VFACDDNLLSSHAYTFFYLSQLSANKHTMLATGHDLFDDDDAGFMKLLASQRELLKLLRQQQEATSPRSCCDADNTAHFHSARKRKKPNRRSSLDMILARRLSIGMGFDGVNTLAIPTDVVDDDAGDNDAESRPNLLMRSSSSYRSEASQHKKLRQVSTVSPYFVHKDSSQLDSSLLALRFESEDVLDFEAETEKDQLAHVEANLGLQEDVDVVEPLHVVSSGEADSNSTADVHVDQGKVSAGLQAAMEHSYLSQQTICDLDGSVNLKASYAVTMQRTSQSRDMLRKAFGKTDDETK
jgi:hypothetical protein